MRSCKSWVMLAALALALALGGCVDSDRQSTFEAGVGGTVTGLAGEVTLVLNGGESLRVSTNGAFSFSTRVPAAASYSVTIGSQPANQICSVAGGSGTMPYASINSVVVSCAARSHAVGGNISGLIGSVTLSNGADSYTTSTDGPFAFAMPVAEGAAYAVTVQAQPDIQTCSVINGAGTMGTSAVDGVVVVCSTDTFAVGGTVSGLAGDVVLQNNGGDPITLSSNGSFEFPAPVAQGSAYAVTIQTQPATQTCSVSQGTGTVGAGDVSNVTVVCSTNTFTLGGTVVGLSGAVALQNNGGDNIVINSDGAFTFPSPVAQGSNYVATVLTQPATQTCTITNGVGTMGMSDVVNVTVTCSLNSTSLWVPANAVIPVHTGIGFLQVVNTGSVPAWNVTAKFPLGWTSVAVDASDCTNLAPAGTCYLGFTSSAPYVAQNGIEITADNVSLPPTVTLAFAIDGFLVFSVDSVNTASVIDSGDVGGFAWSHTGVVTGATSLTDGAANTAAIVAAQGTDAVAANACHTSSVGGVPSGTWYLPAVCQMANSGDWAGCPAGIPNLYDNLGRFGFYPLMSGSGFWSSTELDDTNAWGVATTTLDPSEVVAGKYNMLLVHCARSISY